jgi:hypothetical protein
MKGLKGGIMFVLCLWGVVVYTYAASVRGDYFLHKSYKVQDMMSSSCSSSSSSSSGGE